MRDWIKEVEKFAPPEEVVKIVIGNKSDLDGEREVTHEEIKVLQFTQQHRNSLMKLV